MVWRRNFTCRELLEFRSPGTVHQTYCALNLRWGESFPSSQVEVPQSWFKNLCALRLGQKSPWMGSCLHLACAEPSAKSLWDCWNASDPLRSSLVLGNSFRFGLPHIAAAVRTGWGRVGVTVLEWYHYPQSNVTVLEFPVVSSPGPVAKQI